MVFFSSDLARGKNALALTWNDKVGDKGEGSNQVRVKWWKMEESGVVAQIELKSEWANDQIMEEKWVTAGAILVQRKGSGKKHGGEIRQG